MSNKKTLGHIDCPSCGLKNGMRINHDKNGKPFGFCAQGCCQQLRVGGCDDRVSKFVARYPWAGSGDVVKDDKQMELPEVKAEEEKQTAKAKPFDFLGL